MNKVYIQQYYDWWFDSAIEFLGHLLETVAGVPVEWVNGISFDELNDEKIRILVEKIEEQIDRKLKYQNPKTKEIKWRHYLPLTASNSKGTYKNKYLSGFLGLERRGKSEVLSLVLRSNPQRNKRVYHCDVCSADVSELTELTQGVYPTSNNQINSLNGIRLLRPGKICNKCQFLGYLNWLDEVPFVWEEDIKSANKKIDIHLLLYPFIENIGELHSYKKLIRSSLTERRNSNVVILNEAKKEFGINHYSLMLKLLENIIRQNRVIDKSLICKHWIALTVKKDQIRTTYCEEIMIPDIESLARIFHNIKQPYSDFIDKTFISKFKKDTSTDILDTINGENKYFMSKGLLMDDFHAFSKAFQIRQNCGIAFSKDSKKVFDRLINLWRCGK
jgi:hypothetical protein